MTDPANPVPLVERVVLSTMEIARYRVCLRIAHSRAATYLIPGYLRGEMDDSTAIQNALATAALSAIQVPVEVQGLIERLNRDATCMEAWAQGIGPYPATVQGVSAKHAERARQAATALAQLAATIAALTAERDAALDALREIAVNEIARAAIVKEMKG